jgi:hypothetical protein
MTCRHFLLIALLLPSVAYAEDAEHRADRLRTQALNAHAMAIVSRRGDGNSRQRNAYRAAMDRYERQRAEWRERVDACRGGQYDACDQR